MEDRINEESIEMKTLIKEALSKLNQNEKNTFNLPHATEINLQLQLNGYFYLLLQRVM